MPKHDQRWDRVECGKTTDAIGGVLFGAALTAVFALLYDQLEQRKLRGTLIAVPVLSAFLIFGGYHAASAFHSNLSRYAHRTTTQKLELANWTDGAWHEVPASRIDLIGEEEEALSIQWAGTAKELTSALSKYDWKAATDFTWHDGLKLLSPGTQLKDIAPLPLLHQGKVPIVTLVQTRPGDTLSARLVWRFWQTEFVIRIGDQDVPLLVGSLSREVLEHPLSWLSFLREERPANSVPEIVISDLANINMFSVRNTALSEPVLIWK